MKNSIRLIGFFAIFTCLQLQAQEMANGYYNYILNPFNLNPAFAGNNGNISAILNTKSYLSGFEDAPRNTMFGIHAPLNDIQGIGARVISDQRGAFQLTKYDAAYSYQIQIDEASDLRFGVSAGALRRMLNPSLINNIELLDQSDQTLAGGYYDETSFTAGVGMVYDYENFQFGFSVPHLVIGNEQLSEYMLLSFGYRYQIQETDFEILD